VLKIYDGEIAASSTKTAGKTGEQSALILYSLQILVIFCQLSQ
jgi:hypothetical protein